MSKITQDPDGSYRWNCSVDTDYHRKSVWEGLVGILGICAFVFILFLFIEHGDDVRKDIWIPLLVDGIILLIALPLLYLWAKAEDPHESYVMTEDYVKYGYGKSSVYAKFKNTGEAEISEKYIEMSGKYRTTRIYVPFEDMEFVREFILKRLPDDVLIRYR